MSRRWANPGFAVAFTLLAATPALGQGTTPAANPTTTPAPIPSANPSSKPIAPTTQTHGIAASNAVVNASPAQVEDSASGQAEGTLVDQVIGVVNGDLILESDVDQERNFGAFQPLQAKGAASFSRDDAIERLVDRALILQQAKLQPDAEVTPAQVQAELQSLRKDIPACKQFHCETDAGWQKFVEAHGFTVPGLTAMWRERMQILKFIEIRFRSGIQITPAQIKAYYDTSLLPVYAKQGANPPKLDAISDRIQEILLQQQVSSLLADWLLQLKAQGSVRMMRPGEVQP